MTVQATNPAGSSQPLQTINYKIKFVETTNSAGTCAAASPPGNPCNDIFVLLDSRLLNETFNYDGQTYFVNAFPLTGNVLSMPPNAVRCCRPTWPMAALASPPLRTKATPCPGA